MTSGASAPAASGALCGGGALRIVGGSRHEDDRVALDEQLLEVARHCLAVPHPLHCLAPLPPRLHRVIRAQLPRKWK